MLVQINKDNKYLSNRRNEISDEKFAKWNRKVYEYDKNSSDLVLKKEINVGYDVPRRISNKMNPENIRKAC